MRRRGIAANIGDSYVFFEAACSAAMAHQRRAEAARDFEAAYPAANQAHSATINAKSQVGKHIYSSKLHITCHYAVIALYYALLFTVLRLFLLEKPAATQNSPL